MKISVDNLPAAVVGTRDNSLDFAGKLEMPVSELLRRGEPDFKAAKDLPDLDDDSALAEWLSRHPRVLQRPIVVDSKRGKAVIGRPPENVCDLLS